LITDELKASIRVPYALRRIPVDTIASLLPASQSPQPGDIVLTRLEKIGKNTRLELTNGRPTTLQEGDLLAVVYGNRYATHQFEGYTGVNELNCDLLSIGGLCGVMRSKYDSVPEPSKLYVIGALGDGDCRPLRLRDFVLPPLPIPPGSKVIVVCGSSMDIGKTYSAASVIAGLRRIKKPVTAIKLTGTVSGRDTWSMLDAGAGVALDFVDGGYPSTYQCNLDNLLELYNLLLAHAVSQGAEFVVVEIADGLLQAETAALLQCQSFTATIDACIFATSDPLAAKGGIDLLRTWGVEPLAISGLIAKSPLAMAEAQAATGVRCMTGADLRRGELNRHVVDDRMVSMGALSGCPQPKEGC
jgi:hypothetical protein